MNSDDARARDALAESAVLLALTLILPAAFGVAGNIILVPLGLWAMLALRGLRTHRRAGRPITKAALGDAALLRLLPLTRGSRRRGGGRDA